MKLKKESKTFTSPTNCLQQFLKFPCEFGRYSECKLRIYVANSTLVTKLDIENSSYLVTHRQKPRTRILKIEVPNLNISDCASYMFEKLGNIGYPKVSVPLGYSAGFKANVALEVTTSI